MFTLLCCTCKLCIRIQILIVVIVNVKHHAIRSCKTSITRYIWGNYVECAVHGFQLRPNTVWRVDPPCGEVAPEDQLELTVTANLDDCVKSVSSSMSVLDINISYTSMSQIELAQIASISKYHDPTRYQTFEVSKY